MTSKLTKPKKTMSKADRALCDKLIALLKQLQIKIHDPSITAEQMAHIEARFIPKARQLLSYWQSKRSR